MNWPKLSKANLSYIFISFILFLFLFWGGKKAYQEFGIIYPIKNQLSEVSVIDSSKLYYEKEKLIVELGLGETENLQDSIQEINAILDKNHDFELKVVDQRDHYLETIWRESRFPLEEAVALNSLVAGKNEITKNLEKYDLDKWLLEMDNEYLYLQIHNSDSYLYEIISRNNQK